MNKNLSFANASALTMAFVWVICSAGVALLPDLSLTLSKWFMHNLDVAKMGTWQVTFDGFLLGGFVLVGFAWITGYVFGWSLRNFSKVTQ